MENVKTIPLHDKHLALKAKMAPFAGFNMPLQYTSVKDEVLAVRNNCGVFDVSHMGEFFATGPEANQFVDYVMSNQFASSPEGKAVYSPLCNLEGGVVDDMIAYKINNQKILICVNASNIEKDFHWLNQFKSKFNFELTNHSDKYCLLAVQGPKTIEMMKKCGIKFNEACEYYSIQIMDFNFEEIILARTGYTGEDGFEIFCSQKIAETLWDKLLSIGVTPCGLASRDVLRLEVCYPLYGHELNDQLSPTESGISWTVKMNKSDFVGKSALSIREKKFQLVKLKLSQGIPRQGYEVLNSDNNKIGEVTSGTHSVTINQGICFALLNISLYPKDEKFYIKIRENKYQADLVKKPFVNGGHK